MHFHDLRHIAAPVLLSEGVPAKVASEVPGHSQIELTLDTYSRFTPRARREAGAAVDRAFGACCGKNAAPV